MVRVSRPSDRIKIDIGGLVFTISPLTYDQKTEIQVLAAQGGIKNGLDAARLAVKYAVKDVNGLEELDGSEFRPQVDTDGVSNEDLDVIFNLEQCDKLSFACLNLLQSVPREFINPHTGEPLEGVKFVKESDGKKSRTKSGA